MSPLDSDRPLLGSSRPSTDMGEGANEDFLFHLYRGSELLQDNRVLEAKEELEEALKFSPRDVKGQDLLAVVYFRLGLYPRAISIFEGLRRTSPRDPALKLNLALCYLKTGQMTPARRELEELTELHPNHARAWGYLGLAYDRLGEFVKAERAFALSNHPQMARRMSEKRAESERALPLPEQEARAAATGPYRAVEAGLSPIPSQVDIHGPKTTEAGTAPVGAPRPAPSLQSRLMRRAVLVAQPAPAAEEVPAPQPSEEKPTVVPDILHDPDRTMPSAQPPFVGMRVPSPVEESVAPAAAAPEALSRPALRPSRAPDAPEPPVFGAPYDVVLHEHLGLVRLDGRPERGFAARLSAVRSLSTTLTAKILERHTRASHTPEAFGGAGNPMVDVRGSGELVLGARPGHTLARFFVGKDAWFLREETLVGLDLAIAFENGRLTTSEGEQVSLVQLRGTGAILVQFPRTAFALDVRGGQGVSARKEAILGWTGRIVPRALAPDEAPCGQRGLLAFAGDGQVFLLT